MRPLANSRRLLAHYEDKRATENSSGVVYTISCRACQEVYIGETGRNFGYRFKEHKKDVRDKKMYTRAGRKVSEMEFNQSAIRDYATKHNHVINWDEASIMYRQDKGGTRSEGDLD